MKENPRDEMLQRDMREGRLSKDGFLGDDDRDIQEIISDDEAVLATVGITAAKIADTMRALTQEGLKGMGEECPVGDYMIKVEEYMGFMGCPFKDGFRQAKRNTTIRNQNGKTMIWTDVNIHLIGAHGFFQGKGAEYRLEPMELIEFLELKAD
ncbi:MAG: hypothetical protein GX781_01365 [Clostridiales bacterium]|nr:hypothetical protein [Clostridiales bacterium]